MKYAFLCVAALAVAFTTAQADITTGLTLHYPLETDTGTDVVDAARGIVASLRDSPQWANPGLRFPGDGSFARVLGSENPFAASPLAACSVALWVKPEDYSQGGIFGALGEDFALTLDGTGRVELRVQSVSGGMVPFTSTGTLPLNDWSHIAVSWTDTGGAVFHLRGRQDSVVINPFPMNGIRAPSSFYIGRTSFNGLALKGTVRDVRYYSRALAAADAMELAPFALDPAYAGLWTADVELNEVKEARTATWGPAPAFRERLIMHVDSEGNPWLLGEATLMKTRATAPALPQMVVISQPSLIPSYDGITPRGGQLIGQRFSSAGFPVPAAGVRVADATTRFGAGWLMAETTLSASDRLNPFRHKYHPDLATGRTLGRTMIFHKNPGDSPSDNTFSSTVYEIITGLHKDTLEARGPATFTRVSTAAKLNQP